MRQKDKRRKCFSKCTSRNSQNPVFVQPPLPSLCVFSFCVDAVFDTSPNNEQYAVFMG